MKLNWIFLVLSGLVVSLPAVVNADISYTGSTINENFDSLGSTTVNGVFSSTIGVQANVPGSTGFAGTKIAGTGTTSTNLIANDGSANNASGSIYSFGATSASDRALGAIASGSNTMAFGFRLVNNSANVLQDITVSFTQENWRSSTSSVNTPSVNTIAASWSTSASPADFLSTPSGFTAVSSLDLVGPAPVATNGALDGNLAANQTARSFTFAGINLAVGSSLYLRWQDFNDVGNDAGLAIDNMTISATAVPEPTSAGLLALAGVTGMAFRRRRS
jgi:hypothetical protein